MIAFVSSLALTIVCNVMLMCMWALVPDLPFLWLRAALDSLLDGPLDFICTLAHVTVRGIVYG